LVAFISTKFPKSSVLSSRPNSFSILSLETLDSFSPLAFYFGFGTLNLANSIAFSLAVFSFGLGG